MLKPSVLKVDTFADLMELIYFIRCGLSAAFGFCQYLCLLGEQACGHVYRVNWLMINALSNLSKGMINDISVWLPEVRNFSVMAKY